jgi:DNA ligase D-like protein (predicted ligase)
LQSKELSAEYRIYNTKENQWLLERLDTPQKDWLRERIEPMLAQAADAVPASADYLYEVKWDGIRALIALDEGEVRIHGRNGLDITAQFPELLVPDKSFRASSGLFDGEIVCLEADGKPNFRDVIYRMQQQGEGAIGHAKASHPAVCYLFDCLYLDGRAIVNETLTRRREWLADTIKKGSAYRLSEAVEEGQAFLDAAKQLGLEGIMAKRIDSGYVTGKRSEAWLKIKIRQTVECVIVGYTKGTGDREATFGALHLAQQHDGGLKYVGKVGSGFDEAELKGVWGALKKLTKGTRTAKAWVNEPRSVWIEPRLVCEVRFASLSQDGLLREPVFVRLRPDLTINKDENAKEAL